MNFLKQLFQKLWGEIEPEAKDLAEQALDSFEAKITPDVLKLATDAVSAPATIALGGTAARDAAVSQLKTDLVTAGHDIATWAANELNALVELAYIIKKPVVAPNPPAQS